MYYIRIGDSFFKAEDAAVKETDKKLLLTEKDAEVVAFLEARAKAQEEATRAFEAKQAAKASGLKKFAEAMPSLTADELKALFA